MTYKDEDGNTIVNGVFIPSKETEAQWAEEAQAVKDLFAREREREAKFWETRNSQA